MAFAHSFDVRFDSPPPSFVIPQIHKSLWYFFRLPRIYELSGELITIADIIRTTTPLEIVCRFIDPDFPIASAVIKFSFGAASGHTVHDPCREDGIKVGCFASIDVKYFPKYIGGVKSCTVPPSAPELVLTFLNAHGCTFGDHLQQFGLCVAQIPLARHEEI